MSATPKGHWTPFLVAVGAIAWLLGVWVTTFMSMPANLIFGAFWLFWLIVFFVGVRNYRRYGSIQPRQNKQP